MPRKVTMNDYRKSQIVRINIIAELYKRGYGFRQLREEVMKRLGLTTYSLRTVHKDVHRMLEEWRETRIENVDLAVQLELERLDDIIREAWAAWDKSKIDSEKKRYIQRGKRKNGETDIKTTSFEQYREEMAGYGDTRYLDVIHRALIERRKLLGLYAPEKKELSGGITFENFLMETGVVENHEEE